MAREERAKHLQMYPGWSARDNYAIHKKRKKRKIKQQPQQDADDGESLLLTGISCEFMIIMRQHNRHSSLCYHHHLTTILGTCIVVEIENSVCVCVLTLIFMHKLCSQVSWFLP